MITAYVPADNSLKPVTLAAGEPIPDAAVWIDLLHPSDEELVFVDRALNLDVPTEEDMREIEISSRLYQEEDAFYMTATMITQSDMPQPLSVPVSFVLAHHRLLTLRYAEPLPFRVYAAQASRHNMPCATGEDVLAGLLDAITDRIADILERVQVDIETLSREIFTREHRGKKDYNAILARIGRNHALTSQARESLVSFGRLVGFVARPSEAKLTKSAERGFKTISRDVTALSDHASFLANNIGFVLDATLGLINNEQSSTIKIFSVAAVVFLPPTLIASIYGMNFEFMPELAWSYGYPMALGLMVLFAVLPYLFFKYRGWL
ncbi:Mg2 transporter protein CorA family protein [Parvibaculum lavamentivorans DS-1]|uniref:Magnesium transport protein CorA n=1 Tax=Parvibaculum lavamentivorans (strain DS-1 / DSM 13023 / NCIMB 13966) TaxID=402881 RepID=A7HW12_PARL1|nr:magnesium transporter CorA family protein [Parvibaculum lavamentivorans]ABS64095.1 Mg2 transporter protein CorA family protein [Parvibaculum lavamentivorans DS-1]